MKLVFKTPVKLNFGKGKDGKEIFKFFPKSAAPQDLTNEDFSHWYIQAMIKEGHVEKWEAPKSEVITAPSVQAAQAAAQKAAASAKKEKVSREQKSP
jgi:hypothetical protein